MSEKLRKRLMVGAFTEPSSLQKSRTNEREGSHEVYGRGGLFAYNWRRDGWDQIESWDHRFRETGLR